MIREFVRSLRLAARRVRWDRALGVALAAAVLFVALFGAAHLCGDGHEHDGHEGHDHGPSLFAAHDAAGCGLCFAWTASRSVGGTLAETPTLSHPEHSGPPRVADAQRIVSFERHAFAAPRGPPAA